MHADISGHNHVGWMIFSILNFRLAVLSYAHYKRERLVLLRAIIGVYEHDPRMNVNESFGISKQK